jgi:hypothetical protein
MLSMVGEEDKVEEGAPGVGVPENEGVVERKESVEVVDFVNEVVVEELRDWETGGLLPGLFGGGGACLIKSQISLTIGVDDV